MRRRRLAVRFLQSLIVVFVATTISFCVIRLAPGDPFSYEASTITPALRQQLREQFGVDQMHLPQVRLRGVARHPRPMLDGGAHVRVAGNPEPGPSFRENKPVANITMETFYQQPNPSLPKLGASCMQCHYTAAQTDFSYTLTNRAWPPTLATKEH